MANTYNFNISQLRPYSTPDISKLLYEGIGNLPQDYYQGQQQAQQLALANMFPQGLKPYLNPDGSIDPQKYADFANKAAQIGGYPVGSQMMNNLMRMWVANKQAQSIDTTDPDAPTASPPAGTPHTTAGPKSNINPSTAPANTSAGDTGGDVLVNDVVSAALGGVDGGQKLPIVLAKKLGVDPNQPLTTDQQSHARDLLDSDPQLVGLVNAARKTSRADTDPASGPQPAVGSSEDVANVPRATSAVERGVNGSPGPAPEVPVPRRRPDFTPPATFADRFGAATPGVRPASPVAAPAAPVQPSSLAATFADRFGALPAAAAPAAAPVAPPAPPTPPPATFADRFGASAPIPQIRTPPTTFADRFNALPAGSSISPSATAGGPLPYATPNASPNAANPLRDLSGLTRTAQAGPTSPLQLPPGQDRERLNRLNDSIKRMQQDLIRTQGLPGEATDQDKSHANVLKQRIEQYTTERQKILDSYLQRTAPTDKEKDVRRSPEEIARAAYLNRISEEQAAENMKDTTALNSSRLGSRNDLDYLHDASERIDREGFYSGPYQEFVKRFKEGQWLLGGDRAAVTPMEMVRKEFANNEMAIIKDLGNSGLGRILMREVEAAQRTVAGMGLTPETNRAMLEIAIRLRQRTMDFQDHMLDSKSGVVDNEFRKWANKYVDDHPLITRDEMRNPKALAPPHVENYQDFDRLQVRPGEPFRSRDSDGNWRIVIRPGPKQPQ